eukprot:1151957-Pelagomonas_calceolata.AAC.2
MCIGPIQLLYAIIFFIDLGNTGPASLFVAWGIVAPLMLWGVGNELQLLRGYPAVEALIVSCVNIFLSTLPVGGVIGQHALFISMASMELWTQTLPAGLCTNSNATRASQTEDVPSVARSSHPAKPGLLSADGSVVHASFNFILQFCEIYKNLNAAWCLATEWAWSGGDVSFAWMDSVAAGSHGDMVTWAG